MEVYRWFSTFLPALPVSNERVVSWDGGDEETDASLGVRVDLLARLKKTRKETLRFDGSRRTKSTTKWGRLKSSAVFGYVHGGSHELA